MARSVVLGNGSMLVGLDESGQVRDLYFPHAGLENHISEFSSHRIGVRVDNDFRWIDHDHWNISIAYEEDVTMASIVTAHCDELGVTVKINDVVYNEEPIFIRDVHIQSHRQDNPTVTAYFGQEFRIAENNKGDTAFYDPRARAIIHYKSDRAFLINGQHSNGQVFDDYNVGLYQMEGHEGSFRAAEGETGLGQNAIEHGSVDSIFSLSFNLPAGATETVHYWIAAGTSIEDVKNRNRIIKRKQTGHIFESTTAFWRAWLDREDFSDTELPHDIMQQFRKSLLVVRAHADHQGGIIASSDSSILNQGRDTYAYVWPRDAGVIAHTLDKAGDTNVARAFYNFAAENITPQGYLHHKYLSNGARGSSWHPYIRNGSAQLPIQEDETGIVIFAVEQHYQKTKDIEYIESIYNDFIKKAADFMLHYRDNHTGLMYGSYDLWEEKFGVHTYTAAVVFAALQSAARLAETLGKHEDAREWNEGAHQIKMGTLGRLWNDEKQMFIKGFEDDYAHDHHPTDETLDVSSWYAVWRYGLCDVTDDRVEAGLRTIKEKLWNKNVGGLPRYTDDKYYRVSDDLEPNPWIITTLWVAQYHIARGESEQALELIKWAHDQALETGILPEQVHPETGEPLSATPLVWSHAEFISTVIDYINAENGIYEDILS